jgi:hypothetical protein
MAFNQFVFLYLPHLKVVVEVVRWVTGRQGYPVVMVLQVVEVVVPHLLLAVELFLDILVLVVVVLGQHRKVVAVVVPGLLAVL